MQNQKIEAYQPKYPRIVKGALLATAAIVAVGSAAGCASIKLHPSSSQTTTNLLQEKPGIVEEAPEQQEIQEVGYVAPETNTELTGEQQESGLQWEIRIPENAEVQIKEETQEESPALMGVVVASDPKDQQDEEPEEYPPALMGDVQVCDPNDYDPDEPNDPDEPIEYPPALMGDISVEELPPEEYPPALMGDIAVEELPSEDEDDGPAIIGDVIVDRDINP